MEEWHGQGSGLLRTFAACGALYTLGGGGGGWDGWIDRMDRQTTKFSNGSAAMSLGLVYFSSLHPQQHFWALDAVSTFGQSHKRYSQGPLGAGKSEELKEPQWSPHFPVLWFTTLTMTLLQVCPRWPLP